MKNLLGKLFKYLGKANSEDNGNPSNTRVIIFYSFFLIIPCVAFSLLYVTIEIKTETLILGALGLVLSFLAGLLGIKRSQKKDEKPEGGQDERVL